jgi:hypothetical protein
MKMVKETLLRGLGVTRNLYMALVVRLMSSGSCDNVCNCNWE